MSRRNSIKIIFIIAILIIGGLIFMYFSLNASNKNTSQNAVNSNPFGNLPSNKVSSSTGNQSATGNNNQNNNQPKNQMRRVQRRRRDIFVAPAPTKTKAP